MSAQPAGARSRARAAPRRVRVASRSSVGTSRVASAAASTERRRRRRGDQPVVVEQQRVHREREPDRREPQRVQRRDVQLLGRHVERAEHRDRPGRSRARASRSTGASGESRNTKPALNERSPEIRTRAAAGARGRRRAGRAAARRPTRDGRRAARRPPARRGARLRRSASRHRVAVAVQRRVARERAPRRRNTSSSIAPLDSFFAVKRCGPPTSRSTFASRRRASPRPGRGRASRAPARRPSRRRRRPRAAPSRRSRAGTAPGTRRRRRVRSRRRAPSRGSPTTRRRPDGARTRPRRGRPRSR